MQNRNPWIPVTSEKPGLSGDSHAEVLGNHMETTNWHELLGIYSGLLQDDTICNSHQNVSPLPIVDLNHKEHVHDRLFGFDQGPANLHSDSLVWNANPLSELSGTKDALYAPPANGVPMGITLLVDKHMTLQPDSQVESNWTTGHKAAVLMLQQNHVLHSSQDIGSYNVQHLPNASYWPSYNLNLPPGSEAGESSTTHGSFRLAPVTPDKQKHSKSSQLAGVPPLFIDKFSIPGKDKQENIHVSLPPEDASAKVTALPPLLMDKSLEKNKMKKNVKISHLCEDVNDNHDEFLKNGDMSPVVITTSLQEKNIPEDGNYREIDLNKTPHQKPPKRRKHRPKVIVERKPKRIPRPAPTNNNTPEGNPSGKRTYKLKKDIKTSSSTQPTDAKNEVKAVNPSSAAKSCRRVLNFEVETGVEKESKDTDGGDKAETNNENKLPANANSNSQDVEQYMGLHAASKTYEVKEGRLKEYSSEKHEILPQVSLSLASVVPSTTGKDHTLNVIARILNLRNAQTNESGSQNRYKQVNQCISGGLAKLVSRANATKVNLDPRRQWMLQSRSQHLEDLHDITQEQGLKGEYSATQLTNPGTVKMGSQLSCHRGLTPGLQSSDSFKLWQNVETSKRKKVKGKFEGTSYSVPSTTNTVKHCSKQVDGRGNKQTKNAVNHVTAGSRNLEDPSQRDPISSEGNQSIASPVPLSLRKQTAAPALSSQAFSMDEVFNQQAKHQYSSKEPAGSEEKPRYIISVDEITNRLENLHIACNSMEIVGEEQNALVPYQGDGAIVPHMEFSHLRKHKPRPKVDLDPETNRLWNLLMGKKGSESTETMDEDREKRWEGERNVFRGRIDSFIARMHLVQGDRRFSKWKGSVVDSVIGVFLTQNVSDHLSSSAYMSLAAKFPLQTTTIRPTCCQNDGSQFVGHQIQIDHPGQNKCYDQRMMSGPTCNFSFLTSRKSSEHGEEKDKTITTRISAHLQDRREEENVMASQSSVGSFFSEVIDSEFKDEIFGCNFRREYSHNSFQQTQIIAGFQDYQYPLIGSSFLDKRPMLDNQQLENHLTNGQNLNLDNGSLPNAYPITASTLHNQTLVSLSSNYQFSTTAGLEEWEARFLGLPGKEIPATGAGHAQDSIAPIAESSLLSQQTGMPKIRESRMDNTVPNMHQEQQISVPARFHTMNGRDSINFNQEQRGETVQPGSTFMKEPKTCADALNKKTSGNGHQVSSTEPSNEIGPKTSNVRKRKVEKEKTEAFNWDSLRKQVDSKIGQKERSKETMDSLDYEALRNADVREISETIKERGMNNMLAERIKDFLDRLVREQGRIDLEWLRYVPPDKSKDYLLSIRGLGLKSVECVRLLTLHHLAFPVDTNVGRIAVRLGWVPLQPLPESLQLHLLELYPVLESIQKYLWPRLCNLDQKTLYELHYQMITFGKVFCTKREPNCNACPMRGECRHFASAFASARLALPGPEEGRLVSSPAPAIADKNSGIKLKLMPLPPLEDNFNRGAWLSMGYCEPIIEEPTTPEQFTEVSEADIEDAFCEDPDEIPTIKLNIEKFTENLQSFMQEHNMEMENADISKALVALSPELASIPVPKLKNVNRLRTEHQVYELPDSHPLLIGLDRREFDDPSPYLLAIWTPGETADSVEPPESKCNSHGLCDKETCMSCNSSREAQSQTVRGTLLIPCRTAMRGSFPLNGTYFQVNEVFADHESSLVPINVPRNLLWNLPRRTVFFGTSVSTIFKGLSAEGIQSCFWKGFVCVRGFDRKTRAPRPLMARLHFPASKLTKKSEQQIKGSSSAERNQNRKDGGPRQRH